MNRTVNARDLKPGMQIPGNLPPAPGLRAEGCHPIVRAVAQVYDVVYLVWIDGTIWQMVADSRVDVVADGVPVPPPNGEVKTRFEQMVAMYLDLDPEDDPEYVTELVAALRAAFAA